MAAAGRPLPDAGRLDPTRVGRSRRFIVCRVSDQFEAVADYAIALRAIF
jgi:hypothetical protein